MTPWGRMGTHLWFLAIYTETISSLYLLDHGYINQHYHHGSFNLFGFLDRSDDWTNYPHSVVTPNCLSHGSIFWPSKTVIYLSFFLLGHRSLTRVPFVEIQDLNFTSQAKFLQCFTIRPARLRRVSTSGLVKIQVKNKTEHQSPHGTHPSIHSYGNRALGLKP